MTPDGIVVPVHALDRTTNYYLQALAAEVIDSTDTTTTLKTADGNGICFTQKRGSR